MRANAPISHPKRRAGDGTLKERLKLWVKIIGTIFIPLTIAALSLSANYGSLVETLKSLKTDSTEVLSEVKRLRTDLNSLSIESTANTVLLRETNIAMHEDAAQIQKIVDDILDIYKRQQQLSDSVNETRRIITKSSAKSESLVRESEKALDARLRTMEDQMKILVERTH